MSSQLTETRWGEMRSIMGILETRRAALFWIFCNFELPFRQLKARDKILTQIQASNRIRLFSLSDLFIKLFAFFVVSVQFSSEWYPNIRKSPQCALHPVSRETVHGPGIETLPHPHWGDFLRQWFLDSSVCVFSISACLQDELLCF